MNLFYLIIVSSSEEYWNKSQPDDAGAVHGESDVLCLVEVFRNFSRLESVPRAQEDQDHVVDQRQDEGDGRNSAGLKIRLKAL